VVSFNPNNQKQVHNLMISLQLDHSDLSHVSSEIGIGEKCSKSCFLIFLKEQRTGRQGPKGKETEEKEDFFFRKMQPSNQCSEFCTLSCTKLHRSNPHIFYQKLCFEQWG